MSPQLPENLLGVRISEGKKWSIHENGIAISNKLVLWKDVDEIYTSASSYSVNLVPIGSTWSITLVDSSCNRIDLKFQASFLTKKAKAEYLSVYSHILASISERQWREFLQRINDGQRVSFKSFDIMQEGIYCAKHRIFSSGFDKLEPKSIFGSAIRDGVFYIHFVNDAGKVMERWVDYVKNIPNIHIAQAYLELLRSTYYRRI